MNNQKFGILFLLATDFEASTLKKTFGLKKLQEHRFFDLFEADGIHLAVCGQGKLKCAAVCAFALAAAGPENTGHIVNLGIAGAKRKSGYKKGDLFVINKIEDAASGREYFPDMLVKSGLNETHVKTFDHVVKSDTVSGVEDDGLFDMEASGFFEAASMFAGPERIVCFKVVSDFIEDAGRINPDEVKEMISFRLEDIVGHVEKVSAFSQTLETEVLSEIQELEIEQLASMMKLSVTQRHQLRKMASACVAKNGTLRLPQWNLEREISKSERNGRFEQLRQYLES